MILSEGDVLSNNGQIACTKTPPKGLGDELLVLPFPNVHGGGHGHICFGDVRAGRGASIPEKVNDLVRNYFLSEYNTDLTTNYPSNFRPKRRN